MTKKTVIDLQNKTYATIDSCDKEPIHVPGTIQSYGYLLALDIDSEQITHCSANIEEFTHLAPGQVLGASLQSLFERHYHTLVSFLSREKSEIHQTLLIEHHEVYYHLSVYRIYHRYVLEFEKCGDLSDDLSAARTDINELMALVQKPQTLQLLCQSMADYIKRKLEFDRVMIYRFHPDFSGEVYAEAVNEDMEPFLGLRYPAGDIPPQARELYLRNRLRIISDVQSQPVPLLTSDEPGLPPEQIDLSDSVLRSVSPIHIQYLKNMGIGASFSLSIIKDGKLWGLIACHHNGSKCLSPSQRQAALLYGLVLSSQLEVHERAESLQLIARVDGALDLLLRDLHQNDLTLQEIVTDPRMLDISGAQTVIAYVNGTLYQSNNLLTDEQAMALVHFLTHNATQGSLITQKLMDLFPDSESFASVVSGLIYHRLSNATEDCILWAKPGLEQEIIWAGNPEKAVQRDTLTLQLTPRSSFEAWKQIVRNISDQWHSYQINASHLFTSALQKHLHLDYLRKEEEKQRVLAEELKRSNEELENINWISAHDLKEPLRKIRVFTSRMMHMNDLPEAVVADLHKVNNSATRMQSLLDDIMSYARVAAREQLYSHEADLNQILGEVVEHFADELTGSHARITFADLPTIYGSTFQLRQLFMNLIGNALKFSREDVPPEIQVTYLPYQASEAEAQDDTFFVIEVTDNGQGFDEQYKERIFKLFQRLDTQIQGTGIGLSICRKVMENHQGKIDVASCINQGSTFRLYFPARLLA